MPEVVSEYPHLTPMHSWSSPTSARRWAEASYTSMRATWMPG